MKTNNKSKKSESIVSKTKNSLAVLDRREKNSNERIVKLQKRIDKVSKLSAEMQTLKAKQKEIASQKEALLTEIRSIVAAFGSTVPAVENPVSWKPFSFFILRWKNEYKKSIWSIDKG